MLIRMEYEKHIYEEFMYILNEFSFIVKYIFFYSSCIQIGFFRFLKSQLIYSESELRKGSKSYAIKAPVWFKKNMEELNRGFICLYIKSKSKTI